MERRPDERGLGGAGIDPVDQGLTVGGDDQEALREAETDERPVATRGSIEDPDAPDPFEPGVGAAATEDEEPELAKWTADRNAASGGWSGTTDVIFDDMEVEALRQGQGTEAPDEGVEP